MGNKTDDKVNIPSLGDLWIDQNLEPEKRFEKKLQSFLGVTTHKEANKTDLGQLSDNADGSQGTTQSTKDSINDIKTYDSFTDFIRNNSQLFVIMGVFGAISGYLGNFIKDSIFQSLGVFLALIIFLLVGFNIYLEALKIDEKITSSLISKNFIEKYLFICVFVIMTIVIATPIYYSVDAKGITINANYFIIILLIMTIFEYLVMDRLYDIIDQEPKLVYRLFFALFGINIGLVILWEAYIILQISSPDNIIVKFMIDNLINWIIPVVGLISIISIIIIYLTDRVTSKYQFNFQNNLDAIKKLPINKLYTIINIIIMLYNIIRQSIIVSIPSMVISWIIGIIEQLYSNRRVNKYFFVIFLIISTFVALTSGNLNHPIPPDAIYGTWISSNESSKYLFSNDNTFEIVSSGSNLTGRWFYTDGMFYRIITNKSDTLVRENITLFDNRIYLDNNSELVLNKTNDKYVLYKT